jgi:chromosome segregation ATPase
MPTDDQTPEGTLPDGTAISGASSSSSQPVVDWEKRFKGLQATYDKLQKKYSDLEAEVQRLTGDLEEARQGARGHEGEKKTLNEKLAAAEAEKATLQGQVQTHQQSAERARLIMGEFQDLAPFEAKGLLPSAANLEELKQKLTDYRATIGSMVNSGVQNRIAGQSPATSSAANNSGTPSKEQVYSELARLAGTRNPTEQKRYQELMALWEEMNK